MDEAENILGLADHNLERTEHVGLCAALLTQLTSSAHFTNEKT